jgi:hypothetical protein
MHYPTFTKIQKDQAFVYIKKIEDKFNVIVLNKETKKVTTALKEINQKSIYNLGKNYGWRDYR